MGDATVPPAALVYDSGYNDDTGGDRDDNDDTGGDRDDNGGYNDDVFDDRDEDDNRTLSPPPPPPRPAMTDELNYRPDEMMNYYLRYDGDRGADSDISPTNSRIRDNNSEKKNEKNGHSSLFEVVEDGRGYNHPHHLSMRGGGGGGEGGSGGGGGGGGGGDFYGDFCIDTARILSENVELMTTLSGNQARDGAQRATISELEKQLTELQADVSGQAERAVADEVALRAAGEQLQGQSTLLSNALSKLQLFIRNESLVKTELDVLRKRYSESLSKMAGLGQQVSVLQAERAAFATLKDHFSGAERNHAKQVKSLMISLNKAESSTRRLAGEVHTLESRTIPDLSCQLTAARQDGELLAASNYELEVNDII